MMDTKNMAEDEPTVNQSDEDCSSSGNPSHRLKPDFDPDKQFWSVATPELPDLVPNAGELMRLDIAQDFVRAFLGYQNAVIRCQLMHDSSGDRAAFDMLGRIDLMWPHIVAGQRRGFGAYYFLNELTYGPGSGYREVGTNADVMAIRAACIDDPKAGEPTDWHQQPSIIVRTSRTPEGRQKCQALWKLRDCPLEAYGALQERFFTHYQSDRVKDLRRVLRLPGTLQLKAPSNPQLVTFRVMLPVSQPVPAALSVQTVAEGLPPAEGNAAPSPAAAASPEQLAGASHPRNVARARKRFDKICERYRAKGSVAEGARHDAMIKIIWEMLFYTDDVELLTAWCGDALGLLDPGRYTAADFTKEIKSAYRKRAKEGTLACRAMPLSWLNPIVDAGEY